MKVTTEGCLFGSLVDLGQSQRILDIGAGTGLLSLMLAQKSNAEFVAVEANEQAAIQCAENFRFSPWFKVLQVKNVEIQKFTCQFPFDVIVSNPPFYDNYLPANNAETTKARHQVSLTTKQLLESIDSLLEDSGSAWVLYPQKEMLKLFDQLPKYNLHLLRKIEIFNKEGQTVFRIVACIGRIPQKLENDRVIIRESSGEYTPRFKSLLKDYYLQF